MMNETFAASSFSHLRMFFFHLYNTKLNVCWFNEKCVSLFLKPTNLANPKSQGGND